MVIENGRIFTAGNVFIEGNIRFNSRVEELGPAVKASAAEACIDVAGCYVIPGLVDIHTHGAVGQDVCDASPEGLQAMADYYARGGVTSFCATTMTLPEEPLAHIMATVNRHPNTQGARCVGINMEGPFISAARKGAQPEAHILPPDIGLFNRLNDAAGGNILLVDIAPECDENFHFTRQVAGRCRVSFAHSDTSYATAMAGFASGASHVTHLFNGMSPYHQADPGLVGAAMDSGAFVELICDGQHVHPSIVRNIFRSFASGKVCLISDSLRCAGMPDGSYTLAGQPVTVENGRATLENGLLAGSCIHLMEAVRRAVAFGVPLEQAVAAATANPAAAIGREGSLGRLQPGAMADLVILDSQLQVRQVFIGGQGVYQS